MTPRERDIPDAVTVSADAARHGRGGYEPHGHPLDLRARNGF